MALNVALMGVAGLDCYTAREGRHSGDYSVNGHGVRLPQGAGQCHRASRHDDGPSSEPVRGWQPKSEEAAHLIGLIEPEDIANPAVFLASNDSRMVTGHVYPVDSGITSS